LAIDETVSLLRVASMPAAYFPAFAPDRPHDDLLGLLLGRPTLLVGA